MYLFAGPGAVTSGRIFKVLPETTAWSSIQRPKQYCRYVAAVVPSQVHPAIRARALHVVEHVTNSLRQRPSQSCQVFRRIPSTSSGNVALTNPALLTFSVRRS